MKLIILFYFCYFILQYKSEINENLNYKKYLKNYNKNLNFLNNQKRLKTFLNNKEILLKLNKELKELNSTYYLNYNHFLDWFDNEINSLFYNIKLSSNSDLNSDLNSNYFNHENNQTEIEIINKEIKLHQTRFQSASEFSSHINWATNLNPIGQNVLPPVKNQGECGACWAFAAAETTTASIRINGFQEVILIYNI